MAKIGLAGMNEIKIITPNKYRASKCLPVKIARKTIVANRFIAIKKSIIKR